MKTTIQNTKLDISIKILLQVFVVLNNTKKIF